jgi:hypothetical protein
MAAAGGGGGGGYWRNMPFGDLQSVFSDGHRQATVAALQAALGESPDSDNKDDTSASHPPRVKKISASSSRVNLDNAGAAKASRPAQSGDSPPSKMQRANAPSTTGADVPPSDTGDAVPVTRNVPAPPATAMAPVDPNEVQIQPSVYQESSENDLPPLPPPPEDTAAAASASAAGGSMDWLYRRVPSIPPPRQGGADFIPASYGVVTHTPSVATESDVTTHTSTSEAAAGAPATAAQQPDGDYWSLQPAGTEAPSAGLATAAYTNADLQPVEVNHWTELVGSTGVEPPATTQQQEQLANALANGIQLYIKSRNGPLRHVMRCYSDGSVICVTLLLEWNKQKGVCPDKGAAWLCDALATNSPVLLCSEGFLVATTSCYVFRLSTRPRDLLRMSFKGDKLTVDVLFGDIADVCYPSENAPAYFTRTGIPAPPLYCMRYRPGEQVPRAKQMNPESIPDIGGNIGRVIVCFHGANTFTVLQLYKQPLDQQGLFSGFVVWMPHYGDTPRQVDVSRGYKIFGRQARNKVPAPISIDRTVLERLVSITPLSSPAGSISSPATFLFCVNDANGTPNTHALIIWHPTRVPGSADKVTSLAVKVVDQGDVGRSYKTVNDAICSIFGVEPH